MNVRGYIGRRRRNIAALLLGANAAAPSLPADGAETPFDAIRADDPPTAGAVSPLHRPLPRGPGRAGLVVAPGEAWLAAGEPASPPTADPATGTPEPEAFLLSNRLVIGARRTAFSLRTTRQDEYEEERQSYFL